MVVGEGPWLCALGGKRSRQVVPGSYGYRASGGMASRCLRCMTPGLLAPCP